MMIRSSRRESALILQHFIHRRHTLENWSRLTSAATTLNPQVRQGIADGVDDLDEPGIRFLEAIHRRAQTLKRMVK
jgi:hypothetical protein